ncbi:hypothetical protein ES705_48260 [subsurface metagenome]
MQYFRIELLRTLFIIIAAVRVSCYAIFSGSGYQALVVRNHPFFHIFNREIWYGSPGISTPGDGYPAVLFLRFEIWYQHLVHDECEQLVGKLRLLPHISDQGRITSHARRHAEWGAESTLIYPVFGAKLNAVKGIWQAAIAIKIRRLELEQIIGFLDQRVAEINGGHGIVTVNHLPAHTFNLKIIHIGDGHRGVHTIVNGHLCHGIDEGSGIPVESPGRYASESHGMVVHLGEDANPGTFLIYKEAFQISYCHGFNLGLLI